MALETERSDDYALRPGIATVALSRRRISAASRAAKDRAARIATAAAVQARKHTQAAGERAASLGSAAPAVLDPIGRWFRRQPLVRFISASLWRRILASNLVGFFILVGGILYLGWVHTWLIDAKLEALKSQGKIIADSIAAKATAVVRENNDLDPLPNAQSTRPSLYADDGLAALELSLHPEDVTFILRKLVQPTNTRARIYARDGTLIVDTARSLANWSSLVDEPTAGNERVKPQNMWTRLTRYFFKEPLPVYREIGTANGMAYPEVRDAVRGLERSMLLLNSKGEQIVSIALPIKRFNQVQGVLLLSTRPGQVDKILREERIVILLLASVALLATLVTSLLLARTVAGPMRRLSAAAEQVSRNISARAYLPELAGRSDEVGQMAGAFEAMTGALYKRIEASEKFAADVAHELKNPLTAARSTAELLGFAKSEEERSHLVQQIQDELKRLNRLITDVSNASRLDAELARKEMRPIDVGVMLRNVVGIFRDILGDDNRRIVLVIEREPFGGAFSVDGDEGRLGQVLTNLIDNAISFSPENGTVTVRARSAGRKLEILVEDEGPGIPEDRLEIIFDRFYSDRPATDVTRGKNSGLGLSISREIVQSHGGEIVAECRRENGEAVGARFIVRLPVGSQTQRAGAPGGRRG